MSIQSMHDYGYLWDGMRPLDSKAALELFDDGFRIYRLYSDDTEGEVVSRDEILRFDGLFGIEKESL